MGSALTASESGSLTSGGDNRTGHLTGECRKCHKVRRFHPFAAKKWMKVGMFSANKKVA